MTTDEPALLAAIRAQPEEDTPRLVYADFLDERAGPGDAERAEFIRVQMASMGSHSQPQWIDLVARQRSLLRNHWEVWMPELKPNRGYTFKIEGVAELVVLDGDGIHASAQFWRGFVGRLTCDAADWLAHGDAIRARHPVRQVRLTTRPVFRVAYDKRPPRAGKPKYVMAIATPAQGRTFSSSELDSLFDMAAHTELDGDGIRLAALSCIWPGVTFELPA